MTDVIYGTCVQGLGLDLRIVLSYLRTTTTMRKVKMNLVMKKKSEDYDDDDDDDYSG